MRSACSGVLASPEKTPYLLPVLPALPELAVSAEFRLALALALGPLLALEASVVRTLDSG